MGASTNSSLRERRNTALRRVAVLSAALLALSTGLASALTPRPQTNMTPAQLCATSHAGEKCKLGLGLPQADCAGCVSHADWPTVTGVRWQVIEESLVGHTLGGGPANDELLGRHGSDTIDGGAGDDIIWGDSKAENNNTVQHDTLRGGLGNDWIYASHGYNDINGGPGNDHIIAYYGHGTIDCGPGRDTVTIRHSGRSYRLRHCEIVTHPGN